MPPVFIIAAGRDHVVDVRFEHLLRDELRKDGVAVTYLELPWADHSFETAYFGFHNRIAMWYLRPFSHERRSEVPNASGEALQGIPRRASADLQGPSDVTAECRQGE